MKTVRSTLLILAAAMILAACQSDRSETMVLLDEKISKVEISTSNGLGGMNEEVLLYFQDKDSLSFFETAITTARKQPGKVDFTEPDYDVMVEYEPNNEGDLPAHGIHLWLGDEGHNSTFVYIGDDAVYHATPEITKKLRGLILSEG
ncbi:hypothetical protein [Rossellomorea sp. NS-SX7]|uniref:hypothetical protein n=1 Tax=Rossellomorea sp. NS-SX7 TaxID=3463856 RepID=UPI004059301D